MNRLQLVREQLLLADVITHNDALRQARATAAFRGNCAGAGGETLSLEKEKAGGCQVHSAPRAAEPPQAQPQTVGVDMGAPGGDTTVFAFRVGDVVECVNNQCAEDRLTLGARYTVASIGTRCVGLLDHYGGKPSWQFARFKLVKRTKFQVGDKVQVRGGDDQPIGDVVTIHSEDARGYRLLRIDDKGEPFVGGCWWEADELAPAV